LIPFVASLGSLISGYVSDTIFRGRRAPVAAGLYFLETAIILSAAQLHTVNAAVFTRTIVCVTIHGA
jgi:sugar phosphate permease